MPRMVRRVVMLGAGHAHLFTLQRTADFISRGFELVLVAPDVFWYSGLATGVLAAVISSRRVAGDLLKRRSVCAGPCAATAIAWCGLYGVSIGPAVGLLDWLPLSRQSVEWFYAPLVWLHDHSALAGPLEWYVSFWQ